MAIYDLFYEGPNGEVFNVHEVADNARDAAMAASNEIEDGSPWVQVELRRSQAEMDAMFARREARNTGTKPDA